MPRPPWSARVALLSLALDAASHGSLLGAKPPKRAASDKSSKAPAAPAHRHANSTLSSAVHKDLQQLRTFVADAISTRETAAYSVEVRSRGGAVADRPARITLARAPPSLWARDARDAENSSRIAPDDWAWFDVAAADRPIAWPRAPGVGREGHAPEAIAPVPPRERAWMPRARALDGAGVALPRATSFFGEPPWAWARLAVVLHCGAGGREQLIASAHDGWLRHTRHVLAAPTTNASLGTVGFPDMPGKLGVDWQGYKKYAGAQRALFALLYANDTFGASVEWYGARAHRNSQERFA